MPTSLPLRYALPVETFNVNKSVLATFPDSVSSPSANLPTFSLIVTLSDTSNSNGLTV